MAEPYWGYSAFRGDADAASDAFLQNLEAQAGPNWMPTIQRAGAPQQIAPYSGGVAPSMPASAAQSGMLAAAGGPLGVAAMGLGVGADIFDAYQSYKARKEQERLARKMEGRQDIAWNQGLADDARARRRAYAEYRRMRAQQALADIDALRERQFRGM